jgi:hypothetical protein
MILEVTKRPKFNNKICIVRKIDFFNVVDFFY